MKKRILSIFLSLALCLTLLPTTVWAEEVIQPAPVISEVTENEETPAPIILMSGDTALVATEEQLRAAVAAGNDVQLTADITLSTRVVINKNLTIDLNGYTVSCPTDVAFLVDNSSAIFKDSQGGGKIHSFHSTVWASFGSTVTINGGEYFGNPALDVSENASITVLDGSFPCKSSLLSDAASSFSWLTGTLTFKNATFTGDTHCITYLSDTAMADLSELDTIPASLGFYNDYDEALSAKDVLRLPEGYFLADSDDGTVSSTLEFRGSYTILPPEASWGSSAASLPNSGTLAQALSAAAADSNITYIRINDDILQSSHTIGGGTFTIDLNGKKLTANQNYVFKVRSGNVTFKDSVGTGLVRSDRNGSAFACEAIYLWPDSSSTPLPPLPNVTIESGTYQGSVALGVREGIATINGGTFLNTEGEIGLAPLCVAPTKTNATAKLIVNGGTVTGNRYALELGGGSVTITGGTLEYTDTNSSYVGHFKYNNFTTVDLSDYEAAAGMEVYIFNAFTSDDNASAFTLPEGLKLINSAGQVVNAFTEDQTYTIRIPPALVPITFDAGEGGSGTMDPTGVMEGAWYTLPECSFTAPEGKAFAGWLINDGNTFINQVEEPGTDVCISGATTVTALWENACTVTFHANNGTEESYSYGKDAYVVGAELYMPDPTDYYLFQFTAPTTESGETMVFAGWSTSPDGEIVVRAYNPYSLEGDVNFYAQWTVYAPIYVGGVGMTDDSYLASGATKLSASAPAEGGYAHYKDGVLTLHDYVYEGSGTYQSEYHGIDQKGNPYTEFYYEAIHPMNSFGEFDLTVVLEGTSSIALTKPELEAPEDGDPYHCFWSNIISIYGKLTVTGSGKLTLSSDMDGNGIDSCSFIQTGGTLVIRGEDDTHVTGIYAGDITIHGGTLDIDAECAIFGDYNVTIHGGTLTLKGEDDGIYTNSSLKVNGGKLDVEADSAIWSPSITINGGIVNTSGGRHGLTADSILMITGGTVDAAATENAAIYAETLSIFGLSTQVTATTAGETAVLMSLEGADPVRAPRGPVVQTPTVIQREERSVQQAYFSAQDRDDDEEQPRPSQEKQEKPAGKAERDLSREERKDPHPVRTPAEEPVSLLTVNGGIEDGGVDESSSAPPAILAEEKLTLAPHLLITTPAGAEVGETEWEENPYYSILSNGTPAQTVVIGQNAEYDFSIQVGDIELGLDSYLANGAEETSNSAPAEGGYAHLKRSETGALVLTLKDFTYSGSGYDDDNWEYSSAIYSEYPLELVLEGKNALIFSGETQYYTLGIETMGDLTVSGTGSLAITGHECSIYTAYGSLIQEGGELLLTAREPSEDEYPAYFYGVYSDSGIIINGGKLSATANYNAIYTYEGDIVISGGVVDAKAYYDDCIYTYYGNIVINDGKINISAGDDGIYTDDGDITISGGTVDISAYDGIYAGYGDLAISGGVIDIYAAGTGIYADYGDISISGGKLDIYAEEYEGIYAYEGDIVISGGVIDTEAYYDDGIYAYYGNIAIRDGKINIHAGDDGIYTDDGNITISGGEINIDAYDGMDAYYDIEISDGKIDIYAEDNGIYADYGNISISGGKLDIYTVEYEGIYTYEGDIVISGGMINVEASYDDGISAYYGNISISGRDTCILVSGSPAVSAGSELTVKDAQILIPEQGKIGSYEYGYTILDQNDSPAYTALITAENAHTWSKEYVCNATHHWHPCLDENCILSEDISLYVLFVDSGYEEHAESGVCKCGFDASAEAPLFVGGKILKAGQYLSNQGVLSYSKPAGGYAHFSRGVLTLHDYEYTGPGYYYLYDELDSAAVYYEKDLEIVLEGTNCLKNLTSDLSDGIALLGSTLSIRGSGTLAIHAGCDGIDMTDGTLVILSGTIDISTLDGDGIDLNHSDVYFKGGTVTIDAADHGIECSGYENISGDNVYFCGSTVTIEAADDGIDEARTITVSGGTVDITAEDYGFDCYDSITITGGDTTLVSKSDFAIGVKGNTASDGTYQGSGSFTITGGKLSAVSNENYMAIYSNNQIVIGCGMEITTPADAIVATFSKFYIGAFDDIFDVSSIGTVEAPATEIVIEPAESGSHSYEENGLICDDCGAPNFKITTTKSAVTVTLDEAAPDMTVVAASYENGRMTGVDTATADSTSLTLEVSGTFVQIFFLNEDGEPIIPVQPVL